MKIPPQKLLQYNKEKHLNDDDYAKFIFKHAEEWADLMEKDIPIKREDTVDYFEYWKNIVEFLRQNAEELSFNTSTCNDGLSGFQHDCATSLLISRWQYGFELWLALQLSKHDKNYTTTDESNMWVNKYINNDIISILNYKKELELEYYRCFYYD